MTVNYFAGTSVILSLLQKISKACCCFEQWLNRAYKESSIYACVKKLKNKAHAYYKYSFLVNIWRIDNNWGYVAMEESNMISRLFSFFRKLKRNFFACFKASRIAGSLDSLTKGSFFSSVKTASIVIVTASLTNIIIAVFIRNQITTSGWIIRSALLFLGISGMLCRMSYKELMENSFLINKWAKK